MFPKKNKLTRIHPYKNIFEYTTEKEISAWMHRPMRNFLEDPPTYPWLPPTPLVQFNLNYKE